MGKGEPTPKEIKALSEADRMELMWWQVGRGGTGLWNGLNWTSSLRDTIELLTKTPSQQVVAVFWLRLYGVLREVRAAYTPTLIPEDTEEGDLESDSEYDAYHDAETDYFDELAAQVRKQCDRLVAVFSEDELLFIQWKRDAEAHVWLVGYEMGIKRRKKGLELVRGRHHPILDKDVPHERVHAICALLSDRDEISLALEYAGRARLIVDDIIAALAKYPEK